MTVDHCIGVAPLSIHLLDKNSGGSGIDGIEETVFGDREFDERLNVL